jgi:5-methylcytosine-specific restriction endonuclease McrA
MPQKKNEDPCIICASTETRRIKGLCQVCYHRAYYQTHRDEAKQRTKTWVQAHPQKRAETVKKYYARRKISDPAFVESLQKKERNRWSAMSPEERERKNARRRELYPRNKPVIATRNRKRKVFLSHGLTKLEWLAVLTAFGRKCAYCGKPNTTSQDHIVPISQGGKHTIWNVVPACISCNSKKRTGPPLKPLQPLLL